MLVALEKYSPTCMHGAARYDCSKSTKASSFTSFTADLKLNSTKIYLFCHTQLKEKTCLKIRYNKIVYVFHHACAKFLCAIRTCVPFELRIFYEFYTSVFALPPYPVKTSLCPFEA